MSLARVIGAHCGASIVAADDSMGDGRRKAARDQEAQLPNTSLRGIGRHAETALPERLGALCLGVSQGVELLIDQLRVQCVRAQLMADERRAETLRLAMNDRFGKTLVGQEAGTLEFI